MSVIQRQLEQVGISLPLPQPRELTRPVAVAWITQVVRDSRAPGSPPRSVTVAAKALAGNPRLIRINRIDIFALAPDRTVKIVGAISLVDALTIGELRTFVVPVNLPSLSGLHILQGRVRLSNSAGPTVTRTQAVPIRMFFQRATQARSFQAEAFNFVTINPLDWLSDWLFSLFPQDIITDAFPEFQVSTGKTSNSFRAS